MALAFRNSLKIGKLEKITPHYEVMRASKSHLKVPICKISITMNHIDNHNENYHDDYRNIYENNASLLQPAIPLHTTQQKVAYQLRHIVCLSSSVLLGCCLSCLSNM